MTDLRAHRLILELLDGEYAVARLDSSAAIPAWALAGETFSVTRSPEELSVVCRAELVPVDVTVQRGFRALRIQGPLAFSEVGVLDSLAAPLAAAGISIFVVSTYATDYLFVAAEALPAARTRLESAGHSVTDGS